MKVQKLFLIFLIIIALFLALLTYKSIMRPEKFKSVYELRKSEIVNRLTTLRAAQAIYKTEFKKYATDIDSLYDFVQNGTITIVQTEGEIPEGMTEEAAFKAGKITKKEVKIPAKQKVLENDANVKVESLKNFNIIPETGGKKFEIQTAELSGKSALYTICVYRVDVSLDDILANMSTTITPEKSGKIKRFINYIIYNDLENENQYKALYQPIYVGSLTEASTSGSWE